MEAYTLSDFTNKEYLTVLHDRPKYIPTCSSLGLSTPVSGRTGSHGTLTASRPDPIYSDYWQCVQSSLVIEWECTYYYTWTGQNGNLPSYVFRLSFFKCIAIPPRKKNLIQYHPRNPQNSPTTQSLILTASSLTGRGRIKLTKNLK